jgi:UPF0271 protein
VTPRLDLNADVGEHDGVPPASAIALLGVITSASVACGWHAGDATSMRLTVAEAAARGVQIGAHPSYPDRVGFGRRVLSIPPLEVTDAVARQVYALCAVALAEDTCVRHVKPHGALYNVAWHDRIVADAIAAGIVSVDRGLALYAPRGSALWAAGEAAGLRVVAEGFLDRAYEDDGSLTPRDLPGAVIGDAVAARWRALQWARTGRVRTRTGHELTVPLETLCVHGDTPEAATIVALVREGLEEAGIRLLPSLHR